MGIIAVLACVLFLVPYASASAAVCNVTIKDTWVEKPSGDVNDNYTYNVKLEIKASFRPIFVNANLTFGPNNDNRNCQDNRTKSGKIYETTTTISFVNLSFLPLADCDETFKEFTDGKSGWEWDKCWYKFDVEPTWYCKGAETELKGGIPKLTRYKETFDDPHVEQNRTYKGMLFDYSVSVWANINDSIMLQVWNYTNDGWDDKDLKEYPVPRRDQKLTWYAVALTPDNLDSAFTGKYRFVGSG